jgi:hypothetical protein
MNIQEAIEKAGPGGKIRRAKWVEDYVQVQLHTDSPLMYKPVHVDEAGWIGTVDSLTATDWEVVEPETIEVGDVVKVNIEPGCGKDFERRVVWVRDECAEVQVQYKDDIIQTVLRENITLIRKGNKKHEEIKSSYACGPDNQRVHIDLGAGYKHGDCFKVIATRSGCEEAE